MWIKEFMEYAQTKSGGMMTDDKAQATWNNWMEETFSYALSVSLFVKGLHLLHPPAPLRWHL